MIHIQASYIVGITGMGVNGYADVTDATAGTLVVGGLGNWRCQGVFRAHPPIGDSARPWKDLPWFVVGSETNLTFYGPPGNYTFTLTVPSASGSVSKSVVGGLMQKTLSATTWEKPPAGCTPPDGLPYNANATPT